MVKNEFKTVNFTLAENVQLEMVEIPGYPGELENVPEEKMAEIRKEFMLGESRHAGVVRGCDGLQPVRVQGGETSRRECDVG